jgi:hypothetical protein
MKATPPQASIGKWPDFVSTLLWKWQSSFLISPISTSFTATALGGLLFIFVRVPNHISTAKILTNDRLVMQSMAVLLLELAYENKDMEKDYPTMTKSIKKLVRWLRAMKYNDSVASQAYKVVVKIIRASSPTLRAQADDLLALHDDFPPQPEPYQHANAGYDPHQWEAGGQYRDSAGPSAPAPFQQQSIDPWLDYQQDPYLDAPMDADLTPMSFSNPFLTNFDEAAPMLSMQDLWTMPGASFPNIDFSQGQGNFDAGSEMVFEQEDAEQRQGAPE